MSALFDKAIEEARKLPEGEQDALAALILEEIADDCRWAKAFAASQDKLALLADEALEDLRAGRTTPLELPPRT